MNLAQNVGFDVKPSQKFQVDPLTPIREMYPTTHTCLKFKILVLCVRGGDGPKILKTWGIFRAVFIDVTYGITRLSACYAVNFEAIFTGVIDF